MMWKDCVNTKNTEKQLTSEESADLAKDAADSLSARITGLKEEAEANTGRADRSGAPRPGRWRRPRRHDQPPPQPPARADAHTVQRRGPPSSILWCRPAARRRSPARAHPAPHSDFSSGDTAQG